MSTFEIISLSWLLAGLVFTASVLVASAKSGLLQKAKKINFDDKKTTWALVFLITVILWPIPLFKILRSLCQR